MDSQFPGSSNLRKNVGEKEGLKGIQGPLSLPLVNYGSVLFRLSENSCQRPTICDSGG